MERASTRGPSASGLGLWKMTLIRHEARTTVACRAACYVGERRWIFYLSQPTSVAASHFDASM
jgi:hypothetical protein